MRDEAVYILISIVKGYASYGKDIPDSKPEDERNIIDAGIKALRILGVSAEELVTATFSILTEDSPIDRTVKGEPKRPPQDMKTMLKDLIDVTLLKSSDSENKADS